MHPPTYLRTLPTQAAGLPSSFLKPQSTYMTMDAASSAPGQPSESSSFLARRKPAVFKPKLLEVFTSGTYTADDLRCESCMRGGLQFEGSWNIEDCGRLFQRPSFSSPPSAGRMCLQA